MIVIHLPGIPPLQSARKSGRKFYDPLAKEKESLRWLVRSQYVDKPLNGPICLKVVFSFQVPTSLSKKKRQDLIESKAHTKRPDVDNLLKPLCDVLKAIVFIDDNQIFDLHAIKYWAEETKTMVCIWPKENE